MQTRSSSGSQHSDPDSNLHVRPFRKLHLCQTFQCHPLDGQVLDPVHIQFSVRSDAQAEIADFCAFHSMPVVGDEHIAGGHIPVNDFSFRQVFLICCATNLKKEIYTP
jgi:hypothetical protein